MAQAASRPKKPLMSAAMNDATKLSLSDASTCPSVKVSRNTSQPPSDAFHASPANGRSTMMKSHAMV